MKTSRRDLLRLRLGLRPQLDGVLGTRPGTAVEQCHQSDAPSLPGSSAERGYQESVPPWLQAPQTD